MDRSQRRRLVVIGLIIALVGTPAAVIAADLIDPAPTSGSVPITNNANNLTVIVEGDTEIQFEDLSPDGETLTIRTASGHINASSANEGELRVHESEITGTWTTATGIDATTSDITINPGDKEPVVVGGEIDSVSFQAQDGVALDDGNVDFSYSGSGSASVSLGSVEPDSEVLAVDADTGAYLDSAQSDANGDLTFDELASGDHDVVLQQSSQPTLSGASPTGDLDLRPATLSVNVSDPDFGGDRVDVTISLDGTEIHNETISQAGTVSTSIPSSGQTGGEHTWSVTAEDSTGLTETASYTYRVPDTLYIRDELNTSDLITSPKNVSVTFFAEEETYERSTSDGTIDLTGLPVDQDFAVQIQTEDGDDYTSRTIYLQSIYEQQDVYLLNSTANEIVTPRFILEDPTGQYDSTSVLFIQRSINSSGTVNWETIHADEFGAEGVIAELQAGERHRLKVLNEQGDEQIVGPYRADSSDVVTVEPGTPTIELSDYSEGWAANAIIDNRTLEYRYSDPAGETQEVIVEIHERNNRTNRLQPNQTFTEPTNISSQVMMTENESEVPWVVKYHVTRNDEQYTVSRQASNRADLIPGLSDQWRLMVGLIILFISAGAFSLLNASVGAVVVSIQGGVLYWTGWLDGATTAAGVVIAIFISVLAHIYSSARF